MVSGLIGILILFAIISLVFSTGFFMLKLVAIIVGGILMCVFAPVLILITLGGGLVLGIFAIIIKVFLAALRFVF